MMKSMKRMVLTGAAVTVMMSFAAPAMAADFDLNAIYEESTGLGSSLEATYDLVIDTFVDPGPAPRADCFGTHYWDHDGDPDTPNVAYFVNNCSGAFSDS